MHFEFWNMKLILKSATWNQQFEVWIVYRDSWILKAGVWNLKCEPWMLKLEIRFLKPDLITNLTIWGPYQLRCFPSFVIYAAPQEKAKNASAVTAFAEYHHRKIESVTVDEVEKSSDGLDGWSTFKPGEAQEEPDKVS